VRGPEFEPRFYRIEKLSSPDILDDEGPLERVWERGAASGREIAEREFSDRTVTLVNFEPGLSRH